MQSLSGFSGACYQDLTVSIERSRARGLVELLTEANVDIRKGVDPKVLLMQLWEVF